MVTSSSKRASQQANWRRTVAKSHGTVYGIGRTVIVDAKKTFGESSPKMRRRERSVNDGTDFVGDNNKSDNFEEQFIKIGWNRPFTRRL